jgi:hypothetical protein
MASHALVKDMLMKLGDATEYYTVKSDDSESWDIRLGKRHITYRPLRGFKSHLAAPISQYFLGERASLTYLGQRCIPRDGQNLFLQNLSLEKTRPNLRHSYSEVNNLSARYIFARWLVPKMVKNGFYSSFVYWRLIWACLVSKSWPRVKMATHGFQRI